MEWIVSGTAGSTVTSKVPFGNLKHKATIMWVAHNQRLAEWERAGERGRQTLPSMTTINHSDLRAIRSG